MKWSLTWGSVTRERERDGRGWRRDRYGAREMDIIYVSRDHTFGTMFSVQKIPACITRTKILVYHPDKTISRPPSQLTGDSVPNEAEQPQTKIINIF